MRYVLLVLLILFLTGCADIYIIERHDEHHSIKKVHREWWHNKKLLEEWEQEWLEFEREHRSQIIMQ